MENQQNSTNINWFPGHMAKTRRQITEDLKLIDIVVELIDARIPSSSRNPDIKNITRNKKRVIVLNKCDLADDVETQRWIEYYKKQNISAVMTDSNSGRGIQNVLKEIERQMQEELEKLASKGRIGRTIRVMVLGIPNVGKSSFINRISKKTTAEVANRPGVTRAKQWIRVSDKIELLDTPGVLWPKFESEEVGLMLSYTGSIKDTILEKIEIAYNFVKYMLENYKDKLCERYKLDIEEVNTILNNENQMENENIYEVMQLIGRKRGAIVSGGNIDDEKTANLILDDFRSGKLGKITLEKVK